MDSQNWGFGTNSNEQNDEKDSNSNGQAASWSSFAPVSTYSIIFSFK